MYSLLVVDDDYWMRKYLKENINWSDYNVSLAGEAEDGEDALEKLSQLSIDILILDINLPGISGIELMEIVIKRYPHIKAILISGYKEFEYARRAVSLGVLDYILKPVEEEKLISIVSGAVNELNTLKANALKEEKTSLIADISHELIRKKFYEELISKDNDTASIMKNIDILQLDLDLDDRYTVVVFEIDKLYLTINSISREETYVAKTKIVNSSNQILSSYFTSIIIECDGSRYAAIISVDRSGDTSEFRDALYEKCEYLRSYVKEHFSYSITIGIGNISGGISGVRGSYENACKILDSKFYTGNDRLLTSVDYVPRSKSGSFSFKKIQEEIIEGIRKCESEGVTENLSKFKAGIKEYVGTEQNYIKRIVIHFLEEILDQTGKTVFTDEDSLFSDLNINSIIYGCETVDEIFTYLESILKLLINQLLEERKNYNKKLAFDVLKLIEDRYFEDLYLDNISKKINVHPAYLCRVFKKETGEGLIHHLMKFRIEKSKQLLSNPNIKVYEVASMVGYENMKTFSRTFKTIVGVTPKEFREKYHIKFENE